MTELEQRSIGLIMFDSAYHVAGGDGKKGWVKTLKKSDSRRTLVMFELEGEYLSTDFVYVTISVIL